MAELREIHPTETEREHKPAERKKADLRNVYECSCYAVFYIPVILIFTMVATAMYLYNPDTGWGMCNKRLQILKFIAAIAGPFLGMFIARYEDEFDKLYFFMAIMALIFVLELFFMTSSFLTILFA